MPQQPLPPEKVVEARRLKAEGLSTRDIGRKLRVSAGWVSTVTDDIFCDKRTLVDKQVEEAVLKGWSYKKITQVYKVQVPRIKRIIAGIAVDREPAAAPEFAAADEAGLPALPESDAKDLPPFEIKKPGRYLLLSDVHLPQHDVETIRLAVAEARRQGVVGIILNGDILDCHELSRHDKDPRAKRYVEELQLGQQFLAYLRGRFSKADIFYKLGNHEARLEPYIYSRAPALEGIDALSIEAAVEMKKYGVQKVDDKRIIHLGKLHVLHGHEMRGAGGVNPARWLYLKARSVAICGHFHRTSEHHARNIADKYEAAWSLGCACGLKPHWLPINDWNPGFGILEVGQDGGFSVQNKRVLAGKVV